MVAVTFEDLAFPNHSSREVDAIDRRSMSERSELRSRREEWRGNGVKNLRWSEAILPYFLFFNRLQMSLDMRNA